MILFFITSRGWYNLGKEPTVRQVQRQPFIYQLIGFIPLIIFYFIHFDDYKPTKVEVFNPYTQRVEIFNINNKRFALIHLFPGLFYILLTVTTYIVLRRKGWMITYLERSKISSYVSFSIRSRIFSLISTLFPFLVISPIMLSLFYFSRGFGLVLVGFSFICFSILCQYFHNFEDFQNFYSCLLRLSSPKDNISKTKELDRMTHCLGNLARSSRGTIFLNLVFLCYMLQAKLSYYMRLHYMQVFEIKFLFGLTGG